MMMMVRCNAMSALVDEESGTAAASASAGVTSNMPMPMVRCNAMSWTDEEEGLFRVWACGYFAWRGVLYMVWAWHRLDLHGDTCCLSWGNFVNEIRFLSKFCIFCIMICDILSIL
jgi:hypothetical protein